MAGTTFSKSNVVIDDIDGMNLSAIDMNLLVVLDALLEERSVTRAARRVGLSQPAMSNALGRLRTLLSDPVLVRGRSGMVPTDRAARLQEPLRQALADIRGALESRAAFDPETTTRTFTIAATDYADLTAVPAIADAFQRAAPRARLSVRPIDVFSKAAHFSALETGTLDLVIAFVPPAVAWPSGFRDALLFEDELVLVGGRSNRRVGRGLSVARFCELRHVVAGVVPDQQPTAVDHAIAATGHHRNVVLTVPNFLAAAVVVSRTELVTILGARQARELATYLAIRSAPVPVALPRPKVAMVWHERNERSEAHRWLRTLVQRVVR